MRSIPSCTCVTIMREKERKSNSARRVVPPGRQSAYQAESRQADRAGHAVSGKRGRMRPQISRKPFEKKLMYLQDELSNLTMYADDGFDINKLKHEIEEQINHLLKLLEGGYWVGSSKWTNNLQ